MKVEIFTPVPYYGEAGKVADWPVPSRLIDAKDSRQAILCGFEQMEAAYEAGFDSLNLAEHHYSPGQMTPIPHLFAAALAERLPDAQIAILGTDLPLHNPLMVAEQYAMLDNILDGRLRFALLRGTPNEYLTYGTNPWESREKFEEGVELIIRAFTEPEPFGWEGRYFRFRNVSVFPQPVQKPYPRILLSGNSPASARFAGRMRCDVGLSFMAPEQAAVCVETYREAAAEAGWAPTADNILYRQMSYVAETDQQAHDDTTTWPFANGYFQSRNAELTGAIAAAGAAMGGVQKEAAVKLALMGVPQAAMSDKRGLPPGFSEPWIGSPDTVLKNILDARQHIGFGRVELVVAGSAAAMSHETVLGAIKLMGRELIPALHATPNAD